MCTSTAGGMGRAGFGRGRLLVTNRRGSRWAVSGPTELRRCPCRNERSTPTALRVGPPWQEASREVPSGWLKDEGLASWKRACGVPSNVMIELRRWLREHYPALINTALPPARPQRAQARLEGIWARAGAIGERHPTWRPVEGLLRLARDQRGPARATPDGDQPCQQEH